MGRAVLVLVDPDDGRRALLEQAFSRRFEVSAFSHPDLASSCLETLQPRVLLVHINQDVGNGLSFCRSVQALTRELDCMTVVHGRAWGARHPDDYFRRARRSAGADIVISEELSARELLRKVVRGLKHGPSMTDSWSDEWKVEFYSASRVGSGEAPQPTRPRGQPLQPTTRRIAPFRFELIERLPDDRPPTLSEALRARASLHNIRVVLDAPVTPLIEQLPDDRPLALREVLRARITPRNFRVIFRQARVRRSAA